MNKFNSEGSKRDAAKFDGMACDTDVSEEKGRSKTKGKKKRKYIIPVAAGLLAVIIAASIVFFVLPLFDADDYESVVMEYVKAYAQGDVRAIGEVSVCDLRSFYEMQLETDSGGDEAKKEQFFKEASDYYGKDIKNLDDYIDAAIDENQKGIKEYYGEYTLKTTVLSVKELEEEALESLKTAIDEEKSGEGLSLYMDVDTSLITAGYLVEVEVTIDGEENDSTNTEKCTIVEYGGVWKVVPEV